MHVFKQNQARIQDFLQGGGGGVNNVRVLRAPLAPAPTGASRVDKHQIMVHSVHRIFRAIFFDFFVFAS